MESLELNDLQVFTLVTNDIRITVVPEFLPDNSNPSNNIFGYAYHIKVENLGNKKVQLLDRHWKIYSGNSLFGEVKGPGVVGKQPWINPGETFNYSSGTETRDVFGYMEGTYTFQYEDFAKFSVIIPRFQLVYPMAIN
jgi:ApaG protein